MAEKCPPVPELIELSKAATLPLKRKKKRSKQIKPQKKVRPTVLFHYNYLGVNNRKRYLSKTISPRSRYQGSKIVSNKPPFIDESEVVGENKKCDHASKITKELIENKTPLPIQVPSYSDVVCNRPITNVPKLTSFSDEYVTVAEKVNQVGPIKAVEELIERGTEEQTRSVRFHFDGIPITASSKPATISAESKSVAGPEKCDYYPKITEEFTESGAAIQISPVRFNCDGADDKSVTISFTPVGSEREKCSYSIKITKNQTGRGTALSTPGRIYSDGIYGKLIPTTSEPGPFSDEHEAVSEREKCNYSIKITKEQIGTGIALSTPGRIYSDGIYDKLISTTKPAPFSDEPEAAAEREKCDYSVKITKEQAESGTLPRPVRVYSDGVYDLFHQGHARQLMQAKRSFPEVYLIAGVHDDFTTHQFKGKTVMTEQERCECVKHCRYVNEVHRSAPWVINDEFLKANKIDFVAHDPIPYAMGLENGDGDVYHHLKVKGIFVATERTEGVSTSDLVTRIVQNYDMYVRQRLDQGFKRNDLNISLLTEKRYLLQNRIEKIMSELKRKGEEFLSLFL